jgi:prophage tail gpP-like protein
MKKIITSLAIVACLNATAVFAQDATPKKDSTKTEKSCNMKNKKSCGKKEKKASCCAVKKTEEKK